MAAGLFPFLVALVAAAQRKVKPAPAATKAPKHTAETAKRPPAPP